jgi:Flp pilus assembly protein TadG
MTRHNKRNRRRANERRGAITVLAATCSIVALAMVAFAVDVGYVLSSKQELQRAADATALAACWEYALKLSEGDSASDAMTAGRGIAADYAQQNSVGGVLPAIDGNVANTSTGDLVFGQIEDLYAYDSALNTANPSAYNAVRVKIRRDALLNGETPFFFAKIFGRTSMGLDAEATAGYIRNISGFRAPGSGGNLDILPYALDWDTWDNLMNGVASDSWTWNSETKTISAGADGVLEVNLFPQGTGSPGNRGTVDIGGCNNSTADIARQIVYGISPEDLDHHGGSLELDENGELELNGDTGISAGVKDELNSIKGQPRLIPIFSIVVGPGNNAQYTIVHWAGVRIMEVKLTGAMNQKRVIVQPCPMVLEGAIASSTETSNYVYSPVVLVK